MNEQLYFNESIAHDKIVNNHNTSTKLPYEAKYECMVLVLTNYHGNRMEVTHARTLTVL